MIGEQLLTVDVIMISAGLSQAISNSLMQKKKNNNNCKLGQD